jgi:hypothetical protein
LKYETSVVYLEQIPKLEIVTGTDWVTLGGFTITVIVFALGTYYSVSSFRRTLVSQEMIASRQSLKASRQAWINEFRNACADFLSSISILWDLKSERNIWLAASRIQMAPLATDKLFKTENPGGIERFIAADADLTRLLSKIDLLLNPSEADSKVLVDELNAAVSAVHGSSFDFPSTSLQIIKACQKILKTEWEKAKQGR